MREADASEPIDEAANDAVVDERRNADGKVERYYTSRKREVIYSNGTRKVAYPSGHIVLEFNNKDLRKVWSFELITVWVLWFIRMAGIVGQSEVPASTTTIFNFFYKLRIFSKQRFIILCYS